MNGLGADAESTVGREMRGGGNVMAGTQAGVRDSIQAGRVRERPGEATLLGDSLTVLGPRLEPGEVAPDFTLLDFDPAIFRFTPFSLGDLHGKTALLSVVVSLDTPVCHIQTRRWEQEAAGVPGAEVITISRDLPFAQARWKQAEGVGLRTLSAYQDERFGLDYGVLVKETRLLQRSIFVVAPDGRLAHVEYVREQTEEPDYDAALEAVRVAVDRARRSEDR
jgi:thiol peroxidase